MLTIPFYFEFDKKKLQQTEGIISTDKDYFADYKEDDTGLFKQWMRAGRGMLAEYNVFRKLEHFFGNQKCLLVGGFDEKKLLKILKEDIERDLKLRKKFDNSLDMSFSDTEDFYYGALFEYFSKLKKDVQEWVCSLGDNLTEDFLVSNLQNMTLKPGIDLLSEKNQKNYKELVINHFKTKIRNRKKALYSKEEVTNCYLRFLLNKGEQNNEFDFLLFFPVSIWLKPLELLKTRQESMVSSKSLLYLTRVFKPQRGFNTNSG